jgi:hypothetical protein
MLRVHDKDTTVFAPSICAGCSCKTTLLPVDDYTCPYYKLGDFTYNTLTKDMQCPNYTREEK